MKNKRKEYYVVGAIVGILLVIFAFQDLSITEAIYNPESMYGLVLQTVGELPSSITAVCAGAVLITFRDRRVKWKNYATIAGSGLLIIMGASMGCMLSITYAGSTNMMLGVVLMVVMISLAFFFAHLIPKDKGEQAKKIAIMGVLLFVLSLFIFNGVKMTWGRMRYVYMDNPTLQFTPWYLRQGFTSDNTYMSFPSGHAAQSSFILMITLLPILFHNLKKHRTLLNVIAAIWIVLVCSSRVVMGMHFSSDVTMGFAITYVLFQLLKHFYLARKLPQEDIQ